MGSVKNKFQLAREVLNNPSLKDMLKAGFINEINIRNCRIVNDYEKLRKRYNHLDSVETLSRKYFLSRERILSILYKQ